MARTKVKKTPQKTRQSPRRQSNANRDTTPERSSESEHEEHEEHEEQSHSDRSNSDASNNQSYDFLGRAPSLNESSVSEANTTNRSSQRASRPSQRDSRPSKRASRPSQRPSTDGRQPRKQSKPKKRKDHVTRELVKMQSSTKLLIPRLPFQRLVREVLQQFKNDYRMQASSLECLQEASETYLTQLFEDSYLCCLHRSRITLTEKDMRLVQILRGPLDAGRR